MTLRHAPAVVGLALAVVATLASPAEAGGSWPSPVKDRYEPGEVVTIVGYTSMASVGRYYGWLRVDSDAAYQPQTPPAWPFVHPTDLPLGPVTIENTEREDWAGWRVSLTFPLPADLTPGEYEVVFCNDPCTQGLGDVVGAVVHVGVDPREPPVRNWPIDDPAVAQLEPDALLWYFNGTDSQRVTAAQVRAGDLPEPTRRQPRPEDIDAAIDGTTTTEAPAAPDESSADVRLTPGDSDRDRTSLPPATPWVGALAGAAALFLAVRTLGPGRKHVHSSTDRLPAPTGGQTARRTARWPRRVVRP